VKKPLLLHPLLFALFPVLFVYSQNTGFMTLSEIWPAALLLVGATVLLWLPLALILRDVTRAGAVLALILVLFFSYGPAYRLLWGGQLGDSVLNRPLLLIGAWGAIFAAGTALILRNRSGWADISRIANVVAFVLVAASLFNIGRQELWPATTAEGSSVLDYKIPAPQSLPADILPDIYYIILDGYARADVLQDLYGYDNSEFLGFLEERGFYVADRSQANYAQTALSVASSLNVSYLDGEASRVGPDSQDWKPLAHLVRDSAVLSFLKQQGYSIVAFPTGFGLTDLRAADIYLGSRRPWNDLELGLLLMTPIPWLALEDGKFPGYTRHAQRILYVFDHLPETTQLPSPRFVFAHIVAPHPPFVFDAEGINIAPERVFGLEDGERFVEQGGTREEYVTGYVDQLTYINRRVETVLDELLARSLRPTVIVLQSDHGPASPLDWKSLEDTDVRERLSILNAYFLPGEGAVELYKEITPVNTFRLILNRYFGTDLELLEDRSYFSTCEHPYRFLDVTDELSAE